MRELDQQIKKIAEGNDSREMDNLIREWEFFILKTAVQVCKRYVKKTDEEWSVSIQAFMEAVRRYDLERGAFIPFARRIIHNRLVDHFRKQERANREVPLEELDGLGEHRRDDTKDRIRDEIQALAQVLRLYGMDYSDLAAASPKSEKTKKACRKVLVFLKDNPAIQVKIQDEGLLPVKILALNTGVPRKTIERHRKYLIAAVEILIGDYPCLAAYIPLDGGVVE